MSLFDTRRSQLRIIFSILIIMLYSLGDDLIAAPVDTTAVLSESVAVLSIVPKDFHHRNINFLPNDSSLQDIYNINVWWNPEKSILLAELLQQRFPEMKILNSSEVDSLVRKSGSLGLLDTLILKIYDRNKTIKNKKRLGSVKYLKGEAFTFDEIKQLSEILNVDKIIFALFEVKEKFEEHTKTVPLIIRKYKVELKTRILLVDKEGNLLWKAEKKYSSVDYSNAQLTWGTNDHPLKPDILSILNGSNLATYAIKEIADNIPLSDTSGKSDLSKSNKNLPLLFPHWDGGLGIRIKDAGNVRIVDNAGQSVDELLSSGRVKPIFIWDYQDSWEEPIVSERAPFTVQYGPDYSNELEIRNYFTAVKILTKNIVEKASRQFGFEGKKWTVSFSGDLGKHSSEIKDVEIVASESFSVIFGDGTSQDFKLRQYNVNIGGSISYILNSKFTLGLKIDKNWIFPVGLFVEAYNDESNAFISLWNFDVVLDYFHRISVDSEKTPFGLHGRTTLGMSTGILYTFPIIQDFEVFDEGPSTSLSGINFGFAIGFFREALDNSIVYFDVGANFASLSAGDKLDLDIDKRFSYNNLPVVTFGLLWKFGDSGN